MDIYTIGDLKAALKDTMAVYVTSTIFVGGGVSLRTTKQEVRRYIGDRDDEASAGTGDTFPFFDEDTSSLYL